MNKEHTGACDNHMCVHKNIRAQTVTPFLLSASFTAQTPVLRRWGGSGGMGVAGTRMGQRGTDLLEQGGRRGEGGRGGGSPPLSERAQYTANTVSDVVGVDTVAWTGLTFLGVAVVLCGISGAGQCRTARAVKDKKYA